MSVAQITSGKQSAVPTYPTFWNYIRYIWVCIYSTLSSVHSSEISIISHVLLIAEKYHCDYNLYLRFLLITIVFTFLIFYAFFFFLFLAVCNFYTIPVRPIHILKIYYILIISWRIYLVDTYSSSCLVLWYFIYTWPFLYWFI